MSAKAGYVSRLLAFRGAGGGAVTGGLALVTTGERLATDSATALFGVD